MRRKPTEAQKQAAEERRRAFRKLARTVGQMSDQERHAFAARAPAIATIEGRALSLHNQVLIEERGGNHP